MNFSKLFFWQPKNRFEIFTDGSHKGKWGSWAFVILCNGKIIFENSGRARNTDSHHMEFQAVIEALRYLPANSTAAVSTDSRVLIKIMTEIRTRPGPNPEQITMLEKLSAQHRVSWKWVRAHAGNTHNERCDELCRIARNKFP